LSLCCSKKTPVSTAQQERWYQSKELSLASTAEFLNAFWGREREGGAVALGVSRVSDTEVCCVWAYKQRCH